MFILIMSALRMLMRTDIFAISLAWFFLNPIYVVILDSIVSFWRCLTVVCR